MTMKQKYILTFIFLACSRHLVKMWLSRRNIKHVLKNQHTVPEKFQSAIELADHQKAANYTTTKSRFAGIQSNFSFVLFFIWTLAGGLEYIDKIVQQFQFSLLTQGLIFFGLLSVVGFILELPFNIYSTFVIEEKFGFNKTTVKTFIVDIVKQTLLGVILGAPFLYALLWIMQKLGNLWWLYAWGFMMGFQFLLLWAYPKFIAPIFNKFTPIEDGEIKNKIEELAKKTGFIFKGIFVMDASKRSGHGNAYFTGFGKNKRIVFFDTLLKNLTPEEIQAVLAHELGHFKKKHVLKNIVISSLASLIFLGALGFLYKQPMFFELFKISRPSPYMALVLFTFVLPLITFYLTPLQALFSRKHEFEADAYAAEYSNGQELISALVKLYKENASTLTPDPLYSKFYFSHPPALERVEYLESL
jgi:STE24 endopeptidase